jgi:hypothetical protein
MCPVCIATAAWIAASATSTGGVSALFVKRLRGKSEDPTSTTKYQEGGDKDGNASEDQQARRRVA